MNKKFLSFALALSTAWAQDATVASPAVPDSSAPAPVAPLVDTTLPLAAETLPPQPSSDSTTLDSSVSSSSVVAVQPPVAPVAVAPEPVAASADSGIALKGLEVSAKRIQAKSGSAQTGYRVDTLSSAGPFRNLETQKTPYSIHAVSSEEIANREAHNSAEVFKTNPTMAVLMSSNTYCSMSRLQSRGFSAADQSVMRDGLVDRGFTYEPVENVQQAEALNGLSSFFNGFATIGGSLNYVTKQPTPERKIAISGGRYNGGVNYLHGDLGGPLDSAGKLGYRLGAYHEEGRTTVKDGRQQRNLFYGSTRYQLSPDITIGANGYYQHYFIQGLSNYFLPNPSSGIDIPDPNDVDPSVQYGQKWTYDESDKYLMSTHLEARLNNVFDFRAAYQYGDMWREYNRLNIVLEDNNGNYTEEYTGSPRQKEKTKSAYALMDAKFKTGAAFHELTFGYTGTYFEYYRGADTTVTLGTSSFSDPAYYAIPAYPTYLTSGTFTYYDNLLMGDRVTWGMAQLTAGLNYAQIRSKSWTLPDDSLQKKTLGATQYAWTPSVALSVTPIALLSLYGNYMEGLSTGGTAGTTFKNINLDNATCPIKNARETLKPSVSRQFEGGAKATVAGLGLSLDYFHLSKVNEYTDPGDSTYKQDGRIVSQGVEFQMQGRLFRALTLGGGFVRMKSEYTQVANNPTWEGNTQINVPETQGRLFAEYSLPGLPIHISGGANYYGKRPIDVPNTTYMSDATTLDAGLRIDPVIGGYHCSLQGNVQNLLDERYWANYRSGEGLELGAPRTYSLSFRLEI
ncbi:MAG TPA: TonB-dependent receptor [Fibrobacteraceae bacterium]|nr:TonB-dependent receptor [Fibrobacteraceae bacterium]